MSVIRLAILRGTTGNNELYNRGDTPWTLIGTLGTKYGLPDILTFTGLALIANGYEIPWKYDGTTLSHIASSSGAVPTGASHHALHLGFYWLWNTAAISGGPGGLDGPSSLRSSELNDVGSYPAANQIFIDKDDGDEGMGMGQFTIAESGISPTTSQILFKNFAAYQMGGVFGSDAPAFTIQKIKSDMGCVAPRTIRFAPGFGLIRLSHRGFALFDGVDDRLISEEIRPLIFGNNQFTGVDWANVVSSYAVVNANPPMYVAFLPEAGEALTRCFVYDLVRKSWTILSFPMSVATAHTVTRPGSLPVTLVGDYDQGHVRTIFNPAASAQDSDNGIPIRWSALLRPVSSPSPQTRGYYHRAIVKIIDVPAGFNLYWVATFGPAVNGLAIQKANSIILPFAVPPTIVDGTGGGWGLSPWGTAPWGDELVGLGSMPAPEVDLTLGLGVIATNLRLALQGTGRCTIRGIEYHVTPKPLTRPSVYF
jgi:hypothetical protein